MSKLLLGIVGCVVALALSLAYAGMSSAAQPMPAGASVSILDPDSLNLVVDVDSLKATPKQDPAPTNPFGERNNVGEIVSWTVEHVDCGPEKWLHCVANDEPWNPWCLTGATWYGFTGDGNIWRFHLGTINGELEAAKNRDWGDVWPRDRLAEREVAFGITITWSF